MFMEMTTELAEFYGALLGDGCLSVYPRKDRKNLGHCTLFTGHVHDRPYYEQTIRRICNKLFGIQGSIQKRKSYNCVIFVTTAKKVFDCLYLLGCPLGKKIDLTIPDIIFFDNDFAVHFVRGIFDTDGTVYNRYSKKYSNHSRLYSYKVVQIKMKQPFLMSEFHHLYEWW